MPVADGSRNTRSKNNNAEAVRCGLREESDLKSFVHLGAFESTKIYGSGLDVLETTRHTQFWEADLRRLQEARIRELRYPVPWHRIENRAGHFDWGWIDGPMELMRCLELQPILDPLHHVSLPDWLALGFLNPEFANYYAHFLEKVAQRYPWAERYTVFNEPLPTLALCALSGSWYPHRRSDADFVAMGVNVARAICLGTAALKKFNRNIQLVHVDACEYHHALDPRSEPWVEHLNCRRFLFHDLVLGRVGSDHPLAPYLKANGLTDRQRKWFQDHSVKIEVLGLDYYAHSEMDWAWSNKHGGSTLRFPCSTPRGFASVGRDYVQRFGLPVLLSETNIGGTVTDRLTWLKFMEEQSEQLAEVSDFRGFCWFPSIDATDWDSLCTKADRRVCPMGIWSLTSDCSERIASELTDWYVKLAQGKVTSRDLPAYQFAPPLNRDLRGYQRLMTHWSDWRLREDSPSSQRLSSRSARRRRG